MHTQFHYLTPNDFSFVSSDNILPQEIINLRKKVGLEPGSIAVWLKCLNESLAAVGIRNNENVLVGIGFLAGNARHGVLCDLAVDPAYRNLGLGNALLQERVLQANEQGIKYLYTELSSTNPLRHRYEELGFTSTSQGLFRAS